MSTSMHWPSFFRWWWLWLLVTVLGSAGSGALGGVLVGAGYSDVLAWAMPIACWAGSILVGLGQALILNQRVIRSALWILATFAGRFLGPPISMVLLIPLTFLPVGDWEPYFSVVGMAIASALLGTAQWLVIRAQIKNAHWWIPASIAGWVLSWVAEQWVLDTFDSLGDPYSVTSVRLWGLTYGTVGGLVVGIITGCAIALLLSQQTLPDQ